MLLHFLEIISCYHLQGEKWDFSFTLVWNTVVWLMLMNFFVKIVNATAQRYLKKQQETQLSALTEKSIPTDSDAQWIVYVLPVLPFFMRVLLQAESWNSNYSNSLCPHRSYPKKSALDFLLGTSIGMNSWQLKLQLLF